MRVESPINSTLGGFHGAVVVVTGGSTVLMGEAVGTVVAGVIDGLIDGDGVVVGAAVSASEPHPARTISAHAAATAEPVRAISAL